MFFEPASIEDLISKFNSIEDTCEHASLLSAFQLSFSVKRLFKRASPNTKAEFILIFLSTKVKEAIAEVEGSTRATNLGILKDKISIVRKCIESLGYVNYNHRLSNLILELDTAIKTDIWAHEFEFKKKMHDLITEMDRVVTNPIGELVFAIQKRKLPVVFNSFLSVSDTFLVRFEELRILAHAIFNSGSLTKGTLSRGYNEFIAPLVTSKKSFDKAVDETMQFLFPVEETD